MGPWGNQGPRTYGGRRRGRRHRSDGPGLVVAGADHRQAFGVRAVVTGGIFVNAEGRRFTNESAAATTAWARRATRWPTVSVTLPLNGWSTTPAATAPTPECHRQGDQRVDGRTGEVRRGRAVAPRTRVPRNGHADRVPPPRTWWTPSPGSTISPSAGWTGLRPWRRGVRPRVLRRASPLYPIVTARSTPPRSGSDLGTKGGPAHRLRPPACWTRPATRFQNCTRPGNGHAPSGYAYPGGGNPIGHRWCSSHLAVKAAIPSVSVGDESRRHHPRDRHRHPHHPVRPRLALPGSGRAVPRRSAARHRGVRHEAGGSPTRPAHCRGALDGYCRHMGGDLSGAPSGRRDRLSVPRLALGRRRRVLKLVPYAKRTPGWPAPVPGTPPRSTVSCWCGDPEGSSTPAPELTRPPSTASTTVSDRRGSGARSSSRAPTAVRSWTTTSTWHISSTSTTPTRRTSRTSSRATRQPVHGSKPRPDCRSRQALGWYLLAFGGNIFRARLRLINWLLYLGPASPSRWR